MGVRNYLVEGVSGTGKTSVCHELRRRGYDAINGDTDLAYQGDPVTGLPTDTAVHEHHLWDVRRVRELVADHGAPVRLDARQEGEWGSAPDERELVVRLHRTGEDVPASGVPIDATRPLAAVVDDILARA